MSWFQLGCGALVVAWCYLARPDVVVMRVYREWKKNNSSIKGGGGDGDEKSGSKRKSGGGGPVLDVAKVKAALLTSVGKWQESGKSQTLRVGVGFGSCRDVIADAESVMKQLFQGDGGDGGDGGSIHNNKSNKINKSNSNGSDGDDNGTDYDVISSRQELADVFSFFFSRGAAGERYVANEQVWQELLEAAQTVATGGGAGGRGGGGGGAVVGSLGGNAALMSKRMGLLGAQVLLGACVELDMMQKEFPPGSCNVQVSGAATTSSAAADGPRMDVHVILEYKKGQSWGGAVCPRANRLALHRDELNPHIASLRGFANSLEAFAPNALVLAGFQMMDGYPYESAEERAFCLRDVAAVFKQRFVAVAAEREGPAPAAYGVGIGLRGGSCPPAIQPRTTTKRRHGGASGREGDVEGGTGGGGGGEEQEERVVIQRSAAAATMATASTPALPVHFELASFVNVPFFRDVCSILLPLCSSLGMNEQELAFLHDHAVRGQLTRVTNAIPRARFVLDQMRSVFRVARSSFAPHLSRIHVHTLAFQVCLTLDKAPGGASGSSSNVWGDACAAMSAASIAATQFVLGGVDQIDDDKVAVLMHESFRVSDEQEGAIKQRFSSSLLLQHPSTNVTDSNAAHESGGEGDIVRDVLPAAQWSEQLDANTRVSFCLVPNLVAVNPLNTIGAGDNISAAGLLAHL